MKASEIQAEIRRLQALERQLEEEEIDKHRETARKFVGKCYKSPKGEILKIIGIPRTYMYMSGNKYEKYQFPAVFLRNPDMPREMCLRDDLDEFTPCCCDTVYINIEEGAPGCGLFDGIYKEISKEEFNKEYDKCMTSFKEKINV